VAYDPVHNVTVVFDSKGLTWEWSASAKTFTQRFPAHLPSVRTGESMAWDPVNQAIVMYGGLSGGNALNDTWLYSVATHDWSLLAPATTPVTTATLTTTGGASSVTGRTDFGMVWDSNGVAPGGTGYASSGNVVIFGGWSGSTAGANPYVLNDSWSWNGNTWTQLDAGGTGTNSPSARFSPGMAYNSGTAQIVIYGGVNWPVVGGVPATTLTYDGATYALPDTNQTTAGWTVAAASGPTCTLTGIAGNSGSSTWCSVSTAAGRRAPGMVYDPTSTQVVLFGGGISTNPAVNPSGAATLTTALITQTVENDTWIFNGSSWTQQTTANKPTGRSNQGMVWDSGASDVVMFGGGGGGLSTNDPITGVSVNVSGGTDFPFVNDLWTFNGTNWLPQTPTARYGHNFVYDSANSTSWLMAGWNEGVRYGDVWGWNGATATWTNANPGQAANAAGVRQFGGAAFDSNASVVQVYGGLDGTYTSGTLPEALYTYTGATGLWSSAAATTNLPTDANTITGNHISQGMAMAYVPSGTITGKASTGAVLTFGGGDMTATTAGTPSNAGGMTGVIRTGATGFSAVTTTGTPISRVGASMAYLGTNATGQGLVMMFGGTCNTHTSGTKPAPASKAPFECEAGVNYAGQTGGAVGEGDFNDVWIGTYTGTAATSLVAWTNVTGMGNQAGTATYPGPRSFAAMTVDASGNVWLTGGATNLTDTGQPLNNYLSTASSLVATEFYQDLWYFTYNSSAGTGTWTQVTPIKGGPTPKAGFGMVFDPKNGSGTPAGGSVGELVTFGGYWNTQTAKAELPSNYVVDNDVWTLDADSSNGTININTYVYQGSGNGGTPNVIPPYPLNATVTLSGPCQLSNTRKAGTIGTTATQSCTGGTAAPVGSTGTATFTGKAAGWYSVLYAANPVDPITGLTDLLSPPTGFLTPGTSGGIGNTQTLYLSPGGTVTFSGQYTPLGSIVVDAEDNGGTGGAQEPVPASVGGPPEMGSDWTFVGPAHTLTAGSVNWPVTGGPTQLTSAGHGLTTGQFVVFTTNLGTNVGFTSTGWTALNGSIDTAGGTGNPTNAWQVTVLDGSNFTIPVDSSGFAANFVETPNFRQVSAYCGTPGATCPITTVGTNTTLLLPFTGGGSNDTTIGTYAAQNLGFGTYQVYPQYVDPDGAVLPPPVQKTLNGFQTTISAANASATTPVLVYAPYEQTGTIAPLTFDGTAYTGGTQALSAGVKNFTIAGPVFLGAGSSVGTSTNGTFYPDSSAPAGAWTPSFTLNTNYAINTVSTCPGGTCGSGTLLSAPYAQTLTGSSGATPEISWAVTTFVSAKISAVTATNIPSWQIVCSDSPGTGCATLSTGNGAPQTITSSTTLPVTIPIGNWTFQATPNSGTDVISCGSVAYGTTNGNAGWNKNIAAGASATWNCQDYQTGTIDAPLLEDESGTGTNVLTYTFTGPSVAGVVTKIVCTTVTPGTGNTSACTAGTYNMPTSGETLSFPVTAPVGNYTVTTTAASGYGSNANPLGTTNVALVQGGVIDPVSPVTEPAAWTLESYPTASIKLTETNVSSATVTLQNPASINGQTFSQAEAAGTYTVPQGTWQVTAATPASGYGTYLVNPPGPTAVGSGTTTFTITGYKVGTLNLTWPVDAFLTNLTITSSVNGTGSPLVYQSGVDFQLSAGTWTTSTAPAGNYTLTMATVAGYAAASSPTGGQVLAAAGTISWTVADFQPATINATPSGFVNISSFTITGPTVDGVNFTFGKSGPFPATVPGGYNYTLTSLVPNAGFTADSSPGLGTPVLVAVGGSKTWNIQFLRNGTINLPLGCGTAAGCNSGGGTGDAGVMAFNIAGPTINGTTFAYDNTATYPLSAPSGTSTTGTSAYTITAVPVTGYALNPPSPSASQLLCYNNGLGDGGGNTATGCPPGVTGTAVIQWTLSSYLAGIVNAPTSTPTGVASFTVSGPGGITYTCTSSPAACSGTLPVNTPTPAAPAGIDATGASYTITAVALPGYVINASSVSPAASQTLISQAFSPSTGIITFAPAATAMISTTTVAPPATTLYSTGTQSVPLSATVTPSSSTVNDGLVTFGVFAGQGVSAASDAGGGMTTVTTLNPHTLVSGDTVVISGATGSWTPINGAFIVGTTPGDTADFTIKLTSTGFGPLTGTVVYSLAGQQIMFASNGFPVTFTVPNSLAGMMFANDTIYISGATGTWLGVNGVFTATPVASDPTNTTFTIPVDSTNFGALSGSLMFVDMTGSAVASPVSAAVSGSTTLPVSFGLPAAEAPGPYTVLAVYGNSTSFPGFVTSSGVAPLIIQEPTAVTPSLAAPASPVSGDTSVTLSASVAGTVPGSPAIGTVGSVTFGLTDANGNPVSLSPATVNVTSGVASQIYTVPSLIVGTYTITATYTGDLLSPTQVIEGSGPTSTTFAVTSAGTQITFNTVPAGLTFMVDGAPAQVAPAGGATLTLSAGLHNIAVASPEPGTTGTQYVFSNWSDGQAQSHNINVVAGTPATYTATFTTQYQLNLSAGTGGSIVSPTSGQFYNAGVPVPISAQANTGWAFAGWSGNSGLSTIAAAGSPSTTITLGAPESILANFSQAATTVTVTPPTPITYTGSDQTPSFTATVSNPNGTPIDGQVAFTLIPILRITAATPGSNPVAITSPDHGLTSGQSVTISGATGDWTGLNNTWTVTQTGANTFTVPFPAPADALPSGATFLNNSNPVGTPPSPDTTNVGGVFTASYTVPGSTPVGAYQIQAAFSTSVFPAANGVGTLDIQGTTTTAVTPLSPNYIQYNGSSSQPVNVTASVTSQAENLHQDLRKMTEDNLHPGSRTLKPDIRAGTGVYSGQVTFGLNDSTGTPVPGVTAVATVLSDGSGTASAGLTIPVGQAGGPYSVTAAYTDPNNIFLTSGGNTPLTIQELTNPSVNSPSITFGATSAPFTGTVAVTGGGSGVATTGTATVTVTDPNNGNAVIGSNSGAVNTSGVYSFSVTFGSAPAVGSYTATATYTSSGGPYADSTGSPTGTMTVNSAGKGNVSTTVTSSVNPSVVGQPVVFTATVSPVLPATGTPTGSVTFLDGGSPIGSGMLTGGVATLGTSVLAQGSHTITTSYSGDSNFNTGTGSLTGNPQAVNQDGTSTAVTSSANPSVFGQSVTFTATVSSLAPGAGTPTGSVTFKDGGSPIGTGTLTAGVATFSTSALAQGSHTITATYNGDSNFSSGTGSLTGNPQVVNLDGTSTAVTSSVNPSVFGQSVMFTATVSAVAPGAGTPTGSVTFKDGGSSIGTGTVTAGVATLSTSALAQGSHTITATYNGDSNFSGSTGSLTGNPQVVNQDGTSTAVTSSLNPSVFGQSVMFTATVSAVAPGAGTPTGSVTFKDGGSSIGTGTVTAGVATLSTSALAQGSHTITATYNGDSNFSGSTGSLTGNPQVVNLDGTSTAVTSSLNPSTFGQSVTFTATVSAAAPGAGTPTGTVTFKDGSTILGAGTLSGGVATLATSALGAGNHGITATYNGDSNFSSGTGSLTGNPQVVKQATPVAAWSLAPLASNLNYGSPLSSAQLSATFTDPTSLAKVPGVIVYTDPTFGAMSYGTVLPSGSYTVTATFTPTDTTDYVSPDLAGPNFINVAFNTTGSGPTLQVTIAPPTRPSSNVLVTVTIANIGGSQATNVTLATAKMVLVPSGTTVSASTSVTPVTLASGQQTQDALSFAGGSLPSGSNALLTVTGSSGTGPFTAAFPITLP
jgi:hypothetical protein